MASHVWKPIQTDVFRFPLRSILLVFHNVPVTQHIYKHSHVPRVQDCSLIGKSHGARTVDLAAWSAWQLKVVIEDQDNLRQSLCPLSLTRINFKLNESLRSQDRTSVGVDSIIIH